MLLNSTPAYTEIWDRVYKILKFYPKCSHTHSMLFPPFCINGDYLVYSFENTEKLYEKFGSTKIL